MAHRTVGETVSKSVKRILTTPPNTWYRQWKRRSKHLSDTRSDYLEMQAVRSESELIVGGFEVMQDWERPVMKALAEEAARSRGHVLEVGFGMGISATYLVNAGCSKYTVIEPHPDVLQALRSWADRQTIPVEIIEGFWEDRIDDLGVFDGILFDVFPTVESEYHQKQSIPFTPKASEHLKPGGVFTFYSGYAETLPPEHVALLERHFSSVRFYQVDGLEPPKDCQYYHDSRMVVPVCVK